MALLKPPFFVNGVAAKRHRGSVGSPVMEKTFLHRASARVLEERKNTGLGPPQSPDDFVGKRSRNEMNELSCHHREARDM